MKKAKSMKKKKKMKAKSYEIEAAEGLPLISHGENRKHASEKGKSSTKEKHNRKRKCEENNRKMAASEGVEKNGVPSAYVSERRREIDISVSKERKAKINERKNNGINLALSPKEGKCVKKKCRK